MDGRTGPADGSREAPSTLHALLVAVFAAALLFALMLFHESLVDGVGHAQQDLRAVVAAAPH